MKVTQRMMFRNLMLKKKGTDESIKITLVSALHIEILSFQCPCSRKPNHLH